MVTVRTATEDEAQGLLEIYAPYIVSSAFTFEAEIPSLEDFKKRIVNGLQKFPWIVCTVNGLVAGYAYASSHRERVAYQWSCECSVYIHEKFKGKGVAKELYDVLFGILRQQGIRNVYAGITLPNDASVSLHKKCGFEHFAIYEHVGFKLGSWQKVGWWRLRINNLDAEPAPPLKFSQMDHQLFAEAFNKAAQRIQSKLT